MRSTRSSRCALSEASRNTSSAAAMSATSSRPLTSTLVLRSPAAMRRMRLDRPSSRRSRPPTNSEPMARAATMATPVTLNSSVRPVSIALLAVAVAARALSRAPPTMLSAAAMSSTSRLRLSASSRRSSPARSSSLRRRAKAASSPLPNRRRRSVAAINACSSGGSRSAARFRAMASDADSKLSSSGSSNCGSPTLNALSSNCTALSTLTLSSASRR